MPITLGSNIASLRAQTQLGRNTDALGKVFQRLSSGLRIDSASDDAAGLAVASKLNSDSRVLAQGVRNVNDGISATNIASSALESLSGIVQRLQELATQSATGTYTVNQRKAVNLEGKALTAEFNRIVATTSFNGTNLLSSVSSLGIQAGAGSVNTIVDPLNEQFARTVGDGTFTTYYTMKVPGEDLALHPQHYQLGDVNGDGIIDVVAALYNTHAVGVYLGNGNGSFKGIVTYVIGGTDLPAGVRFGDFNGDGSPDILVSEEFADRTYVMLNNGDGTFKLGTARTDIRDWNRFVGDFNNDGKLDITYRFGVVLGNGDGTFKAPISIINTEVGGVADFNNDGKLDFITADATNRIFLGNGDGTFRASSTVPGASAEVWGVADINLDGNVDLLGSGLASLGNGDGSFKAAGSFGIPASDYMMAGDLNGDGLFDVVSAAYNDHIYVNVGNGDGTFGATLSIAIAGTSSKQIEMGDLNGDGVLDLLSIAYDDSGGTVNNFQVLLQNTRRTTTLQYFDLTHADTARAALPVLSAALQRINLEQSAQGAFSNRLSFANNNLQSTIENLEAARSRIVDADIAQESADLVRLQILQQASVAILAQANQSPSLALKLLN